jgi:TonB family protein
MTSMILRAAIAAVRFWTRLYTYGLPPELRDVRREEIASDLWHSARDPDNDAGRHAGVQIMSRLLLGIPDDLGWRVEQQSFERRTILKFATAGLTLGAAMVAILAFYAVPSPPEPVAPRVQITVDVTNPPPPPPPVPGAGEIQWVYAETSYSVTGNSHTPEKIKDVAPVYPPIAIDFGVQGTVVVEAAINRRGRVVDARIVDSVPLLDQSTIDAVKQWEFDPATITPVGKRLVLTVSASFIPPPLRRADPGPPPQRQG